MKQVDEPMVEDWIFVGDLSVDAQRALRISVEKFRRGAKEHGPLVIKGKTWTRPMLEEVIDKAHYAIFQLLAIEDAERQNRADCTQKETG